MNFKRRTGPSGMRASVKLVDSRALRQSWNDHSVFSVEVAGHGQSGCWVWSLRDRRTLHGRPKESKIRRREVSKGSQSYIWPVCAGCFPDGKTAQLVCAVPVSPPDTLAKVADMADEVVCLETPEFF